VRNHFTRRVRKALVSGLAPLLFSILKMKKLSTFMALPNASKRVLLVALLMAPLFRVAVSLFSLTRILGWLENSRGCGPGRPPLLEVRTAARLVDWAATHSLVAVNCLARSLLLKWILLRHGIDCQLHIGVRFTNGQFEAHAWIQFEGAPINDQTQISKTFLAFDRPIAAGDSMGDVR
jgi:hypothetical protein